jgi:Tol biopolymer transport system component
MAASAGSSRKWYIAAGIGALLLIAAAIAYYFRAPANGPATVKQISHWNRPMNHAVLSADGRTVAFTSPVGDVDQVFVMLASGGDPLQLTNDAASKAVGFFSSDGTQIYYAANFNTEELWSVPTLGGSPERVATGPFGPTPAAISADGNYLFFNRSDRNAILRKPRSGLGEDLVFSPASGDLVWRILPFPDGKDLLVALSNLGFGLPANLLLEKVNISTHAAQRLGELSGTPTALVWGEPGQTVLLSRTVNDVTNIWEYTLRSGVLRQVTTGAGPDYLPMPDASGKGIYFVNGRRSGTLSAYNTRTKQSIDLTQDEATQPDLSPDGRHVAYITLGGNRRQQLWISDINGNNRTKLADAGNLETLGFSADDSQFLFSETAESSAKVYLVRSDGSGLRQLPWSGISVSWAVWTPDSKAVYFSGNEKDLTKAATWRASADGSTVDKFVDGCGAAEDISADGQYLLFGNGPVGLGAGVSLLSVNDRKCTPVLPDLATLELHVSADNKYLLYALAQHGNIIIYRQPWKNGKLAGAAEPTMKLPFTFRQSEVGNAYDFSKDLSTVVYARPGGHADLYYMSQR